MLKLNKLMASSALAALLAFSSAGISFAGFEEAVKAYEAGDYKTAMDEWMVLADKNDPAAMRNIGHLYRRGLGTDVNYERALHWYKRSAELGFPRAQANVASMYLKGQGVPQDYVQAADWFTKAARNGHTIAQYNLGLMYEYGKGVEKSASKALAWYNLAAKAGHPKALNKLSILVATTPDVKAEVAETEVAKETTVAAEEQKAATAPPVKTEAPVAAAKVPPKKMTKTPSKPEVAVAESLPKAPAPEPKAPEPKVAEKTSPATVSTPAAKPAVSQNIPTKRKDPFAGSANNKLLNDETKGAPTAFNAPAPKPAKLEATQKSAPQVVDTTKVEKPIEPAPVVKPKPSAVVVEAPTVEAPKAPVVVAEQKKAEPAPEKEESKGFFSSLKSLIVGDDETAESGSNVASAPVPQTLAPASAIPAPAPQTNVQPVERVVTGNGLSIAERMEMAQLSFTLEQYQQALSVWAPLAQEGNAEAQYHLGQMFYKGYAVPVDRVKAYYWWSKAKSNGSEIAASSLEQLDASLTFIEKQQLKSVN